MANPLVVYAAATVISRIIGVMSFRVPKIRLDHKFTSARYGDVIPVVFGTHRVPGKAITRGLVESNLDAEMSGTWTQSNVNVMLGQGPMVAVHRGWIRGADGALNSELPPEALTDCGFVFRPGSLTDPQDPSEWMQSALGAGAYYPGIARLRAYTLDLKKLHDEWVVASPTSYRRTYRYNPNENPVFELEVRGFNATVLDAAGETLVRDKLIPDVYRTRLTTSLSVTLPHVPHRVSYAKAYPDSPNQATNLPFTVSGSVVTFGPSVTELFGPSLLNPLPVAIYYDYEGTNTSIPAPYDAHPADVLASILGPEYWAAVNLTSESGVANRLETEVGADGLAASSYRTYCHASGFYVSATVDQQMPVRDHIRELLDATDSEAVWSVGPTGGKLKILPYGDTEITGNGYTYQPNVAPLYDLDYSDLYVGDDKPGDVPPVEIEPLPDSLVPNALSIQFRDRYAVGDPYRDALEEAKDVYDIWANGLRKAEAMDLEWIVRASHAKKIAHIRLQRGVHIKNVVKVRLGWRYARLEPMDLIRVRDEKFGLVDAEDPTKGVVLRILRVLRGQDGAVTVEAIEWPFGVASATVHETESSDTHISYPNVDPGPAEPPLVVPVPALLAGNQPAIWIAATGLSERYGGCDVYVSADGVAYSYVDRIDGRSRMGVLTGELPSGDALDETNTLAVDLADARGILTSTSAEGRDDLETLCVVVDA